MVPQYSIELVRALSTACSLLLMMIHAYPEFAENNESREEICMYLSIFPFLFCSGSLKIVLYTNTLNFHLETQFLNDSSQRNHHYKYEYQDKHRYSKSKYHNRHQHIKNVSRSGCQLKICSWNFKQILSGIRLPYHYNKLMLLSKGDWNF